MVPEKYIKLGFKITKFGNNSKALRFNQKPVFIFSSNIDNEFLTRICETYLQVCQKRQNLNCLNA